jgi:hypothetical protein
MEGRYADPDACVVACRTANKDHVYFDFYQTGSYHNRCFCGIECEVLYADPNSNQYVLEGTSCLTVHSIPNLKAEAIPNPSKKEFLRSSQLDSPPAMQLILSIGLLVFFVLLFVSMALYRYFGHHTSHSNGNSNNATTSRPSSLKSVSLSSSSNSSISYSTVAKSPSCANLSVNLPRGASTVKLLSKTPGTSPATSKPPSPKSPKILKV